MDSITYKGLLEKDIPPIEYLVDKIIPKAMFLYMYGPPGSFKTNFLLYVSLLGLKGQDVFNYEVKAPFKTLWIDEENRDIGMKEKLRKFQSTVKVSEEDLAKNNFIICQGINILSEVDLKNIEKIIEKEKPNLLVIDSIAKVFRADERDEGHVKFIFQKLNPIIVKHGVTIILIHHTRKKQQGQSHYSMEDLSGSREFGAHADGMLCLEAYRRNEFKLQQTKNRYGELMEPINFEIESDEDSIGIHYIGLASENIEKHKKSTVCSHLITGYMEDGCIYSYKDIEKIIGRTYKKTTIYEALKILLEKGIIEKPRKDAYVLV